jgi:ATP-dependent Clp protease ATP-binding subunit ClpC
MGIELSLTPTLKKYIVDKYSDAKMGARPLKRAIQSFVEDELAQEILAGHIHEGDKVTASVSGGKIRFKTGR